MMVVATILAIYLVPLIISLAILEFARARKINRYWLLLNFILCPAIIYPGLFFLEFSASALFVLLLLLPFLLIFSYSFLLLFKSKTLQPTQKCIKTQSGLLKN